MHKSRIRGNNLTKTDKIKVVFFGSPDIAVPSFERLLSSDEFDVKALVTQPPRPSKRGKKITDSNIKKAALAAGVEVLEPVKLSKEPEIIEKLKAYETDFFVTFAFGQILSQEVLDIPKFHTVNLHASLLPKYRGANPICAALMSGDEVTGITTMITVLELDAGDICLSENIKLDFDTDFVELSNKIAEKSPDLIIKTLKGLYEGSIKPYPQDRNNVTFTKKMKKEDKELSFEAVKCDVHNKVRALCGVNTCHFIHNNKIVKVLKTDFCDSVECGNFKCGEVISVSKEGIAVKCLDGAIMIKAVKPEGKGEMTAYAWSLGSKIKCGDKIGKLEEC